MDRGRARLGRSARPVGDEPGRQRLPLARRGARLRLRRRAALVERLPAGDGSRRGTGPPDGPRRTRPRATGFRGRGGEALRDAARPRRVRRHRRDRGRRPGHPRPHSGAAARRRGPGHRAGRGRRPEGGHRRRAARQPADGPHRDRREARPARRARPHGQPRRGRRRWPAASGQAPQPGRPAGPHRRRPRGARRARHRQVRRDDRAHRGRRPPRVPGDRVRAGEAGAAGRQALRPDGVAGPALPVRRRRDAGAVEDGRQRLAEHQAQGAQGRPGDRGRAGAALRGPQRRPGPRLRARLPVATRDGGRLPLHRDRRPDDSDRRREGRHGEGRSDGPRRDRRCRLRQDGDRRARRLQGRAGRQAGRGARADDPARATASEDLRGADAGLPGHGEGPVPIHGQAGDPSGARGPRRRQRRRGGRHPPAAADRRAVEGPRPRRGRRGAALRRRAQGAHQGAAHQRRRAHHERHPDPPHARDEHGRHPRDVDHPHPARGAPPGAHLRGRVRRQAGGRGRPPRAAARRPGLLRAQPGQLDRPGRQAHPRHGARGAGRGGARADGRGGPGEHGAGLLEPRVRRAGVHHHRRDRPGHLQRQHPHRGARREPRPEPAAPVARARGSLPRARLRLLPLPVGEAAHRDRLRPAGDHRAEQRPRRRHGRGHEGPRDPRRRQRSRRRAVRPRRRRRLRPLRAARRRGCRGLPRRRRRQADHRARGAEGGAHRPPGGRAHPARLRHQRPAAPGGVPQTGCGAR